MKIPFQSGFNRPGRQFEMPGARPERSLSASGITGVVNVRDTGDERMLPGLYTTAVSTATITSAKGYRCPERPTSASG